MEETERLQQYVDAAKRIVFFGGAGVSTESGIPDFRSVDGLYHQTYEDPPETILSHSFFCDQPEKFYRFYRDKLLCLDARPNAAHRKLAELEQAGRLTAIITQNIDGLHQAAGSRNVLELHGSVHRNFCTQCGRLYDAAYMKQTKGVPHCACGGLIKPDVVLYDEELNEDTLVQSVQALQSADLLIIGGTSLAVYPAAGLIRYYRGERLVLINRDATPYDGRATLAIHQPIGQVLSAILVR